MYTVERIQDTCSCKICCGTCKACVHMYSCTCLDASLHTTVCKHIHFVHVKYPPANTTDSDQRQHPTYSPQVILPQQTNGAPSASKQNIARKLHQLQLLASKCDNLATLNAAHIHLNATLSVFKVTQIAKAAKLPLKRKYPPNKNCETLFSTKKKRLTATSSLRKPSREEADQCKQSLMKIDTVFCGICLQEEDKLNTQDIQWVQCYQCLMWVHLSCTKLTLDTSDDYICEFCFRY